MKATTAVDPSVLLRLNIRTHQELHQRCIETDKTSFLIQDLIPQQSLTAVIGDSGLGKSPLLYQAALCVAAGIPFLGHPTQQTVALYVDNENGILEADEMVNQLVKHLGLRECPPHFLMWNLNDAPTNYEQPGYTWKDLIRAARPGLVVIDPITAVFRNIEEKNPEATAANSQLRQIMQELGCSVGYIHHPRKPKPGTSPQRLDQTDVHEWFNNARGPRAMINGADVRLGVDVPSVARSNAALVMAGFRRLHGKLPLMHIARSFDEDGEPVGYTQIEGEQLLSQDDLTFLGMLPESFRYKDAERLLGADPRKTTEFLGRLQSANMVLKLRRGHYQKRRVALPLAKAA